MCDSVISEKPFMLVYCPDRYKSRKMRDEVVDHCLAALEFVPDCFDTSKIIKELLTGLHADDNILYFNKDSGDAIFSCNEMGFLSLDLKNINLDDTNYDEDDSEIIIHVRLLA